MVLTEKGGYFPTAYIHRDDIKAQFERQNHGELSEELVNAINALTDAEMTHIASEIGEAATGEGGNFWIALEYAIDEDHPELNALAKGNAEPLSPINDKVIV